MDLTKYVFIESYDEPRIEEENGVSVVYQRQSGLIRKEDWENIKRYMAISLKQGDRYDDVLIDNIISDNPKFPMQDKELNKNRGVREWRTLQRQTGDFNGLYCIFSIIVEDGNGEQVKESAKALMGVEGWGEVEK